MKSLKIALLLMLVNVGAKAQDRWTAFYDEDDYRSGFKNTKGEVMITPKFMGLTAANMFDRVIAAMQDSNGIFDSYYLLKDGTRFGKDSLYVFDMTFDCEQEGFIKFKDPVTEKVGMFDEHGKVAIPAMYNDMTRFYNGVVVALAGAEKVYWDKDSSHTGCNHWSWQGGKDLLINKRNEVLIDSFTTDEKLDYYSMSISDKPSSDVHRVSFRGINGKQHSFIDNERLFRTFLNNVLLNDLTSKNIINQSYDDIVYWHEDHGWIAKKASQFVADNPILIERLSSLKDTAGYSISIEDFIPMPEEMYANFDKFRNNCGYWNKRKFPVFNIVVTHNEQDGSLLHQDNFTFLKTEAGIKFISCSLRNCIVH